MRCAANAGQGRAGRSLANPPSLSWRPQTPAYRHHPAGGIAPPRATWSLSPTARGLGAQPIFAPLHITIVYHSTPGSHLRLATTARIQPERAPRCLNKRPHENRRTSTAALGEGCLASAGAWATTSRAGPCAPAATRRTATRSHRRAPRTKLVRHMVISPLSRLLDDTLSRGGPAERQVNSRRPESWPPAAAAIRSACLWFSTSTSCTASAQSGRAGRTRARRFGRPSSSPRC